MFFLLIQIKSFQVYVAKKTANYLSEKLHTNVSIGSVDVEFFKKIVLEDFYVEDLHHDTLIYAKKLKIDIGTLQWKRHKLVVNHIDLVNAKTAIVKYKNESDLNIQFIVDSFKSNDTITSKDSAVWDFSVRKITLVNTDFIFKNENDTSTTKGVNYSDLHTQDINASVSDIHFDADTIYGKIDYLSTIEKSGFTLKNFSGDARVSPVGLQLANLKIITPQTTLATDLTFGYKSYNDFTDFINKVTIKANFNHSILELDDIAYFAPAMKGTFKQFLFSGKISGKVNDLRGKKMDITLMNTSTEFKGDIKLTGLPNIEETLIYLNVEQLRTNYNDLKQLSVPPFDKNQTLDVPNNVAKLGNMMFKGTFTGLYNDFYAYGDFSSALGKLAMDVSVHHDVKQNKELYKGKLNSTAFDFGSFFDIPTLGKATANITIDGTGLTAETAEAKLDGTINSLEFNHYNYNNIAVEGNIAKQIFKGKLNVKDENVDFDFIGSVDFTGHMPKLDFIASVDKANLVALNFMKGTEKTNLSTQVIINVTGNNIDNLIGHINLDNTIYRRNDEVFKLSSFNLISSEENAIKTIKIFSDFVDAKVSGKFQLLSLTQSFEKLLSNYLPSYFPPPHPSKVHVTQEFEFNCLFKKTDDVTKLFLPQLVIAPKTFLKGSFNSNTNQLSLVGNSTSFTYSDFTLKNWNINANAADYLKLNLDCERFYLSDNSSIKNFTLTTITRSDSLNLSMNWDNKEETKYAGDIKAFLHFNSDNVIKLSILPSQFAIADSVWAINQVNEITIDSSHITIDKLLLENQEQSIALNGVISEDKSEKLKLTLNGFNLEYLNLFTRASGVTFKGRVDGESTVTDFYHNMVFLSNNNFKQLFVNDNEFGNGNIATLWDNSKEALSLKGSFSVGIVPNVLFSGYYYPKKVDENLDLTLNFEAMKLQMFEPFVKDICPDLKGFFAGNISVKGSTQKPLLSGMLNLNAKKITLGYLNTTYNFIGDVVIENNSFGIENVSVFDMNHNKALLRGKVYHNNFKNFQLDFDIQPEKFMCLNTTEINNNAFYGKAYVSGVVNISGFTDNIIIAANVRTESINTSPKADKINLLSKTELTRFFIPLSSTQEVSENNFITFVKKDSSIVVKNDYKVQLGGLTLDFDLDVTPDAEIQLIFDQKVGDVLRSRGNGNIKLEINSLGDFKMFGDYVIENGDYLFTLENIINKKFDLEKGGTIKWSGIPYKADINLSAVYKARASVKPFLSDADSTSSVYKTRYPIDLKLMMTNDLLSPEINFDIVLPTVDASTRQQVMSYINTESEKNRQVFSLLVLNSFVTPSQLSGAGGGTSVGSAATANTSELISNQLSNMLSSISNDFDVGVNYRPGDEISKDQLAVALSTQLFNDKLTIDGNVGKNTTNNQNANNIVGEVNVDYKLTDDGKLRVKAFNRANDNNLIYSTNQYTQGVGVFYREEFNSVGELVSRYWNGVFRRKKKKVDSN